MNGNQISRLAHSLNELRPDWPISSLTTWLSRNLANRAFRDAAVACTWVAVDLKSDGTWASDKLARVLEAGPWWRAAAGGEQGKVAHRNPTRDTQCRRCGGELPLCACARERAVTEAPVSPDLPAVDDLKPRLAQRLKAITRSEETS